MIICDIGDLVRLGARFVDLDDVPVDPTMVKCTVKDPSNTISEPEVIRVEAGGYYAEVDIDQAGRWYYAFDATGNHQASEESFFDVRARRIER